MAAAAALPAEPPTRLSAPQISLLTEISKTLPDSPLLMRKIPKQERVIDAVLAWKPRQAAGPSTGAAAVDRLYLVKWKNMSDVHCCWSGLEEIRDRCAEIDLKSVPSHTDETFATLRFEIDRVVTHIDGVEASRQASKCSEEAISKERFYLIKWKHADYTRCSWETQKELLTFTASKDVVNASINEYMERLKTAYVNPRYILKAQASLRKSQYSDVKWLLDRCMAGKNSFLTGCAGPSLQIASLLVLLLLRSVHPQHFEKGELPKEVKNKHSIKPLLILTDEALIDQWAEHLSEHTNMYCVAYSGSEQSRAVVRTFECMSNVNPRHRFPRLDVLIVPKDVLVSDLEFIQPINFACVVIDNIADLYTPDDVFRNAFEKLQTQTLVFLFTRSDKDDDNDGRIW
uniref:Chromo domain-containing protein n=1 Tax=Lotharella globosa TaxID=91324 RepID=A0A7S3YGT1_9EUKA